MADWVNLRRRDGVALRLILSEARPPLSVQIDPVYVPLYVIDSWGDEPYRNFIFSMRYYGRWLAYDKPEQK